MTYTSVTAVRCFYKSSSLLSSPSLSSASKGDNPTVRSVVFLLGCLCCRKAPTKKRQNTNTAKTTTTINKKTKKKNIRLVTETKLKEALPFKFRSEDMTQILRFDYKHPKTYT